MMGDERSINFLPYPLNTPALNTKFFNLFLGFLAKLGFSYFLTTPCEAWDALRYHEEWRASKLPMNKTKITTSLYKQLDWFENEGSEEERKSAKKDVATI